MIAGRRRLAGLHPAVRRAAEWTLRVADFYGVPIMVTSGYRSWEEQARLRRNFERCVQTGRFGKEPGCMFPANRPGDSSHNWGLSFDSTTSPEYQDWWDAVREYAGFEVLPNDRIHAQVPNWRSYVNV